MSAQGSMQPSFASRYYPASRSPLPRVAAIHAVSVPLALAVIPQVLPWLPWLPWHCVAAGCAILLSVLARLPWWWMPINAAFVPALAWGLNLDLAPFWALGALAVLTLVYGTVWKGRVPLFFSSRRAQQALAKLLPAGPISFLDIGCGDGRVLSALAASRPESRFDGIEHALLPWLAARLRLGWPAAQGRGCVWRGDFWTRSLASYDVVYAFLSPAVMERLWDKALREMRPGTLLVSAFRIPHLAPDHCVEVSDVLRTQLHVWRMGPERGAA